MAAATKGLGAKGAPFTSFQQNLFGGKKARGNAGAAADRQSLHRSFDCCFEATCEVLRQRPDAGETQGPFENCNPTNEEQLQRAWTFKAHTPLSTFLFRSRSAQREQALSLSARKRLAFCDFDSFMHNALVLAEEVDDATEVLVALYSGEPQSLKELPKLFARGRRFSEVDSRRRSSAFASLRRPSRMIKPPVSTRRFSRAPIGR